MADLLKCGTFPAFLPYVFRRLLHYGFLARPWFKNVAKSLRKEPKWSLRDWSDIDGAGALAETFVACHLLKAIEAKRKLHSL